MKRTLYERVVKENWKKEKMGCKQRVCDGEVQKRVSEKTDNNRDSKEEARKWL